MKTITLNQIEKAKDEHCAEQPDSWNMLRNLCKRYIEQETNNADYGDKTKAKKKATKAATKIVKGNCKLGKKGKKAAKSQSLIDGYKNLSPTTKVLTGVGVGIIGYTVYFLSQFQK